MGVFWTVYETAASGQSLSRAAHIGWLIAATGVLAIACALYRRCGRKGRRRILLGIAAALFTGEALKLAVVGIAGHMGIQYLPLHLCSIGMFAAASYALSPRAPCGEFLFAVSMPGAAAALFFPGWSALPTGSFLSVHSFVFHILLVAAALLPLSTGEIRPDVRRLPECIVTLLALLPPIYAINRRFGCNFFFLSRPGDENPLAYFATRSGSIAYPVVVLLLSTAFFAALYGSLALVRRAGSLRLFSKSPRLPPCKPGENHVYYYHTTAPYYKYGSKPCIRGENPMKQKRILSVQDISCFGKCSNTVALPVLSAANLETVILPTALLSNHTGGFAGYTFLDLTDEMHRILEQWRTQRLTFDMMYTGYFGSAAQLADVAAHRESLLAAGGRMLVDPVMGDGGRLYSIYDAAFVTAMRHFCRHADIITPNVTESCLLADLPYEGDFYDAARMSAILSALADLECGAVIITGVRFGESEIGVICQEAGGAPFTLSAPRSDAPLHGTGDVFASALAAYTLNGFPLRKALSRTLAFVSAAIRDTEDNLSDHWYGVQFEGCLGLLADEIRRAASHGREMS